MENPCYRCGHAVEEGVPFCPHCAAPQIRVVITQQAPIAASAVDPLTSSPDPRPSPAANPLLVLATRVSWTDAIRPCALAAFCATLLMALRLYPLVAMLSAGFLAVFFYRQQRADSKIRSAMGARLGALSGLLAFVMMTILGAVGVLVLHQGFEIRKAMLDFVAQAASRTTDPQALAFFERLKSPDGIEFLMILWLLCALLFAIALGAIGGAIGGATLGRRDRP